MKTVKHYLFHVLPLCLVAALLFVSCSKKAAEGDVIPHEALFVANVNIASLWQKGDLANAGDLQMVKELRQQLGAQAPKLDRMVDAFLADPSSCGLNFERDITCFCVSNDGHFPVVVSAWLKDKKNFDNFLSQLDNGIGLNIETSTTNGLDIAKLDNSLIAASNGERVLFINDNRSDSKTLANYAASLFSLKKESCMSSVDNFDKYLALDKDFGVFLLYENLMNLGGALVMSQMAAIVPQEDINQLKKAVIYFTGNFEKGSIDFKSGYYDMPQSLLALSNQPFNDQLLNYMPEQGLIAFTFALNTKALVDHLGKNKEFDLDTEVGIDDLTVADLIKSFGGSMAFSFYGMLEGTPLITLALDINNSETIGDLLDAIGGIEHNKHVYILDEMPLLQVFFNDKVAVISSSTELIGRLANGEKSQGLKNLSPKAKKGNYFYINLNLEQYPADLVSLIGLDNPITSFGFSLFDYIECLSENKTESIAHVYMTDRETNSLAYLLQSVDKLN